MKNNKFVQVLLLVLLLVFAGVIISYYWQNDSLDSIVNVPSFVLVTSLLYVLVQILRRYFYKRQNWWDWLYYLGLLAIMLPSFLASNLNQNIFHPLTDFGTLFLVLPILLDGKQLMKTTK